MKKGMQTKEKIQEQTRQLIFAKGYGAVTMTDISEALQMSAGGLYHHYRSVPEIVLDIIGAGTDTVWESVSGADDFGTCLAAVRNYFAAEKADLLHFEESLNTIIYQYYFSFPVKIRTEHLQAGYLETRQCLERIFAPFLKAADLTGFCDHLFIILHGLNLLAMTGTITEAAIDHEFEACITQLETLYRTAEKERLSDGQSSNS